jgi:hypothetical protein
VAIGEETFAAQGWHRPAAIKAGRRKLSRKKTGKSCFSPEKYRFTFRLAVDEGRADHGMLLRLRRFFYRLWCAATIDGNLTLRAGTRVSFVRDRTKVLRPYLSGRQN